MSHRRLLAPSVSCSMLVLAAAPAAANIPLTERVVLLTFFTQTGGRLEREYGMGRPDRDRVQLARSPV